MVTGRRSARRGLDCAWGVLPEAIASRGPLGGACRGAGQDIGLAVEGRDQTVDALRL
jgi:hypothetical protein